jgi:hypothetical protein
MADHPVPHPDLAGYVLRALEPDASQAFALHLRDCPVCAEEVAELEHLPALLADAAPPAEAPIDIGARTFAPIEDETGRGASRRVGGGVQRMLAVAAGFLLVAGAVALVADFVSGATSDGGTTIRLVSARGTKAKGQAKVRATAQGRAVELTVEGLPRAPAGSYYECWFVAAGDTPAKPDRVSAGTFVVPDPGRHTVEMTSAGSARRFPKLRVTLEPGDGNPQRIADRQLESVP